MLIAFTLPRLSPDLVPLEVLVFGGVMLHGAGLDRVVTRYKRRADTLRAKGRPPHFATYEPSPIMAMSGLFTFAWTTGEMFNIAQRQHQLVADLSEHRQKTRRSKRKSASSEAASTQDVER